MAPFRLRVPFLPTLLSALLNLILSQALLCRNGILSINSEFISTGTLTNRSQTRTPTSWRQHQQRCHIGSLERFERARKAYVINRTKIVRTSSINIKRLEVVVTAWAHSHSPSQSYRFNFKVDEFADQRLPTFSQIRQIPHLTAKKYRKGN